MSKKDNSASARAAAVGAGLGTAAGASASAIPYNVGEDSVETINVEETEPDQHTEPVQHTEPTHQAEPTKHDEEEIEVVETDVLNDEDNPIDIVEISKIVGTMEVDPWVLDPVCVYGPDPGTPEIDPVNCVYGPPFDPTDPTYLYDPNDPTDPFGYMDDFDLLEDPEDTDIPD